MAYKSLIDLFANTPNKRTLEFVLFHTSLVPFSLEYTVLNVISYLKISRLTLSLSAMQSILKNIIL